MQTWMMNPLIGDFWTDITFKAGASYDFQQFPVTDNPAWVGKTVAQLRDQHQVVVLAIWRDGKFHYTPAANDVIQTGDELIAFAPRTGEQTW